MINKKSAPQKLIVSIDKQGAWGEVSYYHKLECGHIEVRKRASSAPKIACTWCVIGEEKGRELKALTIVQPPTLEEVWDFYDETTSEEVDVAKLRAGVASAVGCAQESVEVVSIVDEENILRVSYVTVFLDFETAKKIADKSRNT
ncbi:hypothetical protein UFOVP1217_134 [uncultured Caudovirales phage]|uniref:Uncharacterized protein n=1 Tax=uncultured Caudovirales phage TaxID=2100421 RepID=A0A6J7XCQ4_9CAUD|nr:hypothetical protein UFOVP465_24 [uncultured Caudovirales phage]CAB4156499.1 hypothetical protein UFOVP666_70 [uncultured Caudovirales phage]CAB4160375.1 hypothetical protein UFOVP727_147 [uncultured Caudovirales phage]CAB4164765.1 hypothetical protein UFOVP819_98 [uncultured Caudovirales phage]CAB4172331.1 hypothetical protein UFOVP926_174 [uncultured Caudovirales phage]